MPPITAYPRDATRTRAGEAALAGDRRGGGLDEAGAHLVEAGRAVDRSIRAWREGDHRLVAARVAHRRVVLAGAAHAHALRVGPAGGASLGDVDEALLG